MDMKTLRYILSVSLLPVLLFLAACSTEDDGPDTCTVHLTGCIGPTTVRQGTRALPSGYEVYSPVYPTADVSESQMYIFLQSDKMDKLCRKGNFNYRQDTLDWKSDFQVYAGIEYYLYGFMPAKAAEEKSIEKSGGKYATGATISLSGITPVLPYDLCTLVGVKRRMSQDEDITTAGLQPGSFGYLAPYTDVHLYVMLDHIYANLDISFDIDPDYARLRTVRLKSCAISTVSGPAKYDVTIPLTANETGDSPIGTVTYTAGDGTSAGGGCSLNVPADFTLTTTPQVLHAYVCPGATSEYKMTTVYDVYDAEGQMLVRADATVENRFSLASTPGRGESVTIDATVSPTYLYQLANPDFDNPTINLN